tara:strand:+ start:2371 stop:2613 length:243 start_codon:yes stop_codon:yes gene_type:complete
MFKINYFKRIIKYFKNEPIQLGRWGKPNTNVSLQNRVDWANEDHCGPCGSLILKNNKPQDIDIKLQNNKPQHIDIKLEKQ